MNAHQRNIERRSSILPEYLTLRFRKQGAKGIFTLRKNGVFLYDMSTREAGLYMLGYEHGSLKN